MTRITSLRLEGTDRRCLNHPYTAAIGLTMTYQRDRKVPRFGYCHIITIRSDEGLVLELRWTSPVTL